MSSYCDVASGDPWHGPYHDTEYAFPVRDDSVQFECLVLEINQAGLSWLTVLKKRERFRIAYAGFDIDRVAACRERERARLLADAGIIRNRLKIDAVIGNARRLRKIRASHGGFADWLDAHRLLRREEWVKLFKRIFRFTGAEITGEFLLGTGYLPGAHRDDCSAFAAIVARQPPWRNAG